MSFANWNLLPMALRQLPHSDFLYRLHQGSTIDEFGQATSSYTAWTNGVGMVQPAGESTHHVEGMDISPKKVTVWIYGVKLTGTNKQKSCDQIKYLGCIYNVISVDDWMGYDSYTKCECQEAINEVNV